MELQLPADTSNQLISFNVAALQSMMQAIAREVAEKVYQDAVGGFYLSQSVQVR